MSSKRYERIIDEATTSDVVNLMIELGMPEQHIKYLNGYLILPTLCHNEDACKASHKLYYYEDTKKFYCYTNCKQMSIFDFIINVYKSRGFKYSLTQSYILLERIISIRLNTGFAIVSPPKNVVQETVQEDWGETLTEYNPAVLECFSQSVKYLAPWLKEDISYDTLKEFGVRYDMVHNRIVFPVFDHIGKLAGIKVRNFNQFDIDNGRKYMPLIHNREVYTYPKMKIAYGFWQNCKDIKKSKMAVIFEAEKSVLKFNSFFSMNKSIAIGGSAISLYHMQLLKDIGITKVALAFDNDWDELGDHMYGLRKAVREADRLAKEGFDVDIIYDYSQEHLENSDSPIDKGRVVYSKLYRERKNFNELKSEYLEKKKEEQREIHFTDF